MEKKANVCDFECDLKCDVSVGARWANLGISLTAHLLGFLHTNIFRA